MKKILVILLLLSSLLWAYNVGDMYFPDEELTLTEKIFFTDIADGKLEGYELIDAFLIASGLVEYSNYNKYKSKYTDLLNRFKQVEHKSELPKGKILLQWLHKNVFTSYQKDTRGLKDLFTNGKYDCLSSSLLYYVFANDIGLNVKLVEVPKHVFCRVYNHNEGWINVETTSFYGYQPGRVEIEKIGNQQVKTWVKKKDYKNPQVTDLFTMLGNVYLERNSLERKHYSNKKAQYKDLYIFKKAFLLDKDPINQHNIKAIMSKLAQAELQNKNYSEAMLLIKEGLQRYKNEENFAILYRKYYVDKAKEYRKNGDYQKAIEILQKVLVSYPNSTNLKSELNNCILSYGNYHFDFNRYNKAMEIYEEGSRLFPNKQSFSNNILSCYNNLLIELYNNNRFAEAIKLGKQALREYPNERTLQENIKNIIFNIANIALENRNYEDTYYYCSLGKELFPNDSNWNSIKNKISRTKKTKYYNLAVDYFNVQNYKQAYNYAMKGLRLGGGNSDIDVKLKNIIQKSKFWVK